MSEIFESRRGEFVVSADPNRFDFDVIHDFLARAYWAQGRPRAAAERAFAHSLPFGLYSIIAQHLHRPRKSFHHKGTERTKVFLCDHKGILCELCAFVVRSIQFGCGRRPRYEGSRQIGVARVLSDNAVFAYLMDVFIHEEYRGRGLGQWLLESVMAHPDLRDVRRWMLATRDAHELYARFGFHPVDDPSLWMERIKPFPEEG